MSASTAVSTSPRIDWRAGNPRPPSQLPFTVIDQAVHLLDTAAEPWGIQFEVGLRGGGLDERRLHDAVRAALDRHPMARVRQLPAHRSDRTWQWQVAPDPDIDPVRAVDCPDDAALRAVRDEFYSRALPIVEAPPFRLRLVRGPQGDRLLLNAHHAAFDGFGCVRLLQSVARAYCGEPDREPAVTLEEARDVERLLAAPDAATRRRRLRLIASKLSDLAVRPARLAADGGSDRPGYGIHHAALSVEDTAALDRDDDFTVNDVLLAALHLALEGWNEEHGQAAGRIGVLVPVNLRPKDWQEDVVTNLVLVSRTVTTQRHRRDPRAALEAIAEQTERIKQGGGAALIEAIGGWNSVPLWAKQPLSSLISLTGNRLVCTALLSNLGELREPLWFGDGGGETGETFFSAPTRLPCGLSIGAVTVGGRLHLSYRYRHPALGPDAAARFAQRFQAELARVASA